MGEFAPQDPECLLAFVTQELSMSDKSREVRLQAAKSLPFAARVLKPADVREKLIPFLTEVAQREEDEVLCAVADGLSTFVPMVGGPDFGYIILPILKEIFGCEETIVRHCATKSFNAVVKTMTWNDRAAEICISIIKDLSTGDWFGQKVAACQICSAPYLRCDDAAVRVDILGIFKLLAEGTGKNDDSPMVKRTAASSISDLAKSMADSDNLDVLISELLPILLSLLNHLQDLVRVDACTSLVLLIKAWCARGPEHVKLCFEHTNELITKCSTDTSWRVRSALMKGYKVLSQCYTRENSEFLAGSDSPLFKALQDKENEVCLAAIKIVPALSGLDENYLNDIIHKMMDFLITPTEADGPKGAAMMNVSNDSGMKKYAKDAVCISACIDSFMELIAVPNVDLDAIGKALVFCLELDGADMKIMVLGSMDKALLDLELKETLKSRGAFVQSGAFNEFVKYSHSLMQNTDAVNPTLLDESGEMEWRLRRALVNVSPLLVEVLGTELITCAPGILNKAFEDKIADVRLAAVEAMPRLIKALGSGWFAEKILPSLMSRWNPADNKISYLQRITVINAIGALSSSALEPEVKQQVVPILLEATKDMVPNVRFNAVFGLGKWANSMTDEEDPQTLLQIKSSLESVVSTDTDEDCKIFARAELSKINQTATN